MSAGCVFFSVNEQRHYEPRGNPCSLKSWIATSFLLAMMIIFHTSGWT